MHPKAELSCVERHWHGNLGALLAILLMLGGSVPLNVRAAQYYYDGFEQQWRVDERIVPGSWGSLRDATALNEPYMGNFTGVLCPNPIPPGIACVALGFSDQRTVEYFDKGRMEITEAFRGPGRRIAMGLLVTEMRDDRVQVGDDAFDQRPPAAIALAGDAGGPAPTYADLAGLPESDTGTGVSEKPFLFNEQTRRWERAAVIPSTILPQLLTYTRMEDPNGRYAQNVPVTFASLFGKLQDGLGVIGLPITPVFIMQASLSGATTTLVAQAFERRVLWYDTSTGKVAFGNVGSDYYQ